MTRKKIAEDLMVNFSSFLEEKMGLHFTKDRFPELEKKMLPVSKSFGFNDLSECLQWLILNPLSHEQIPVLAYHLTIGETYFFRDQRRMEVLEKEILPEIINRHRNDKKIRIWSVACCTGEEPYSIAIILDRLIPQHEEWNISILGSDINKEFLRKAELGNYKKWSFRATPHEVRAKYFTAHKEGIYSLIPKVKKMVSFEYFNMVEDSYNDFVNQMDLVLCHNVLIYFSPNQIKKAIYQLSRSLMPEGWLSISSIETPFVNEPGLATRNFTGAIFFKKTEVEEPYKVEKVFTLPPIKEDESLLKVVFPDFMVQQQPIIETPDIDRLEAKIEEPNYQELYNKKQYQELIDLLNKNQKMEGGLVLLMVHCYANLGKLSEARVLCDKAILAEKLDPNLYYMRATIHMAENEVEEAIKSLKKVLFIEPNYVAAHYTLGTLEQMKKNNTAAKRSFRTALELIQGFEPDEELLGAEELTAGRVKEMIETNLRRIP